MAIQDELIQKSREPKDHFKQNKIESKENFL